MKELVLFNYSRILSQGEDARPMIFGLVRIRGGVHSPRSSPGSETDAPVSSILSVTRSHRDTGENQRIGGE